MWYLDRVRRNMNKISRCDWREGALASIRCSEYSWKYLHRRQPCPDLPDSRVRQINNTVRYGTHSIRANPYNLMLNKQWTSGRVYRPSENSKVMGQSPWRMKSWSTRRCMGLGGGVISWSSLSVHVHTHTHKLTNSPAWVGQPPILSYQSDWLHSTNIFTCRANLRTPASFLIDVYSREQTRRKHAASWRGG